jgi:hypothetical protein
LHQTALIGLNLSQNGGKVNGDNAAPQYPIAMIQGFTRKAFRVVGTGRSARVEKKV